MAALRAKSDLAHSPLGGGGGHTEGACLLGHRGHFLKQPPLKSDPEKGQGGVTGVLACGTSVYIMACLKTRASWYRPGEIQVVLSWAGGAAYIQSFRCVCACSGKSVAWF